VTATPRVKREPAAARWTAWALTTGEAGMRNQARGLAAAVAPFVEEKVVHFKPLWRRAPAGTPFLLRGLTADSDPLGPPWPDLLVTCGRRAGAVGLALKARAGGRLKLVHVQDPQTSPRGFDLVVAMPHDRVEGPNVLRVTTALHDVRPDRLAAAASEWAPRFAHLPRPYIGVILGGSTAKLEFSVDQGRELAAGLSRLRAATGGTLLIVPSRRTPDAVLRGFEAMARTEAGGVWVWPREGDNPYLGVLALADRLVVTADSVSMLSEALATTAAVEVFLLPLRGRHARFVSGLFERGLAQPFTGELQPPPPREVIDATAEAAQAVRRLMEAGT
jgi:mitochondrial fission protein ELM1